MSLRIALLGAESTGKTSLAAELARHLSAAGFQALHIPEFLREWCEAQQRTPRPDEQAAIAAEQARRALAATASCVIADTTPLMTAIYSDMLFADYSLYPQALAHQRIYNLTLLTGLDLPWVADGLQRDGPHVREPVDARLRAQMTAAGIRFTVVYGQGSTRLHNALAAIHAIAPGSFALPASEADHVRPPRWNCEKCSDPDCEHRLFRRLIA